MELTSELELKNTLEKLVRLESRYKALCDDTSSDERLRELSKTSLKRLINQCKEEVARYHACHQRGTKEEERASNHEVAIWRHKLQRLEELYQTANEKEDGDEVLRQAELRSLKQTINQLRE